MRWNFFTIGKPALPFTRLGIEEYSKRLSRISPTIHHLRVPNASEESRILLEKSEGMYRVALDERGDHITTEALAQKLSKWELSGTKSIAFLIGGANGHSEELRTQCDWVWSLSKLTLQHEFAFLLLLEQIYRADSILRGHPYHRK